MAIQMDIAELRRLTTRCSDINSSVSGNMQKICTELEQICSNVQSSTLVPSTQRLVQAINVLSTKLSNNLPIINDFLISQVSNYEASSENAQQRIESLISSIGSTFGGDSN